MAQNQAACANGNDQPIAVVRVGETLRGKELEDLVRTLVEGQSDSTVGSWFQNLFGAGSSLGAFFAGFTLSIVASTASSDTAGDSDTASEAKAARDAKVGRFAAISSLLFVVTVLMCSACGLAFAFNKKYIDEKMDRRDGRIFGKFTWTQFFVSILSLVLQLLVLTAILFFFLVMRVYDEAVGKAGIGITSASMIVAFGIWLGQCLKGRSPKERELGASVSAS